MVRVLVVRDKAIGKTVRGIKMFTVAELTKKSRRALKKRSNMLYKKKMELIHRSDALVPDGGILKPADEKLYDVLDMDAGRLAGEEFRIDTALRIKTEKRFKLLKKLKLKK